MQVGDHMAWGSSRKSARVSKRQSIKVEAKRSCSPQHNFHNIHIHRCKQRHYPSTRSTMSLIHFMASQLHIILGLSIHFLASKFFAFAFAVSFSISAFIRFVVREMRRDIAWRKMWIMRTHDILESDIWTVRCSLTIFEFVFVSSDASILTLGSYALTRLVWLYLYFLCLPSVFKE